MKRVLFILFQNSSKGNGGVNSIGEIILNLTNVEPVVITQAETEFTEKLRSSGIDTYVVPVKLQRGIMKLFSAFYYNIVIWNYIKRISFSKVHVNDIDALLYTVFGIKSRDTR